MKAVAGAFPAAKAQTGLRRRSRASITAAACVKTSTTSSTWRRTCWAAPSARWAMPQPFRPCRLSINGAVNSRRILKGAPVPLIRQRRSPNFRLWGPTEMSAQSNPAVSPAIDKQFLLALLRESREKFLSSFAALSEDQARLRPAPDRWSVLETVEHLTTAETIQLKLLQGQRKPRPADAPNRELPFLQMVGERTNKMQSPEIAMPNGRFPSLH